MNTPLAPAPRESDITTPSTLTVVDTLKSDLELFIAWALLGTGITIKAGFNTGRYTASAVTGVMRLIDAKLREDTEAELDGEALQQLRNEVYSDIFRAIQQGIISVSALLACCSVAVWAIMGEHISASERQSAARQNLPSPEETATIDS